jgi:xanthine dehydrogenase accessory factor
MISIFEALSDLEKKGKSGALCTIIETSGSTPRHEGSKMLVYPDGKFLGTVGGGEIESRVIQEALESLKDSKTRLLHYEMIDPKAGDPGVCGGQVNIFVEPILAKPLMLIIGGGHVGKAVAHLAKWSGFRVAVSDDRAELCNSEANPDADEFYPCQMADLPQQVEINPSTYIVLTTRGVAVDIPGLPPLLETDARYIGLIGSKRRWLTTQKQLISSGIPEETINRIHSPIGLDLKAETPEEIAISIMAEVIMVRYGGSGYLMKLQ